MKIHSLFLVSVLCLSMLFVCSAGVLGTMAVVESDNPTVTLYTSGGRAGFTLNRDNSNLFDGFSGVMPGDTLTQEVTVESASGTSGKFRIYLYAVEGEESDPGFIEEMTLKVLDSGTELEVMNSNTESGVGTLTAKGVLLGVFNPGTKKNLTVSLDIPIDMGDDFQDAESIVEWHFYAEQISEGGGGGGDPVYTSPKVQESPDTDIPDGDTPANDEPTIDIPNDENPTNDLPVDIGTEPVPTGDSPQTGDESNLLLWVLLMVGSGSALTILLIFGKKDLLKSENQKKDTQESQRR